MNRRPVGRALIGSVAIGAVVYVALAAWSGFGGVGGELRAFFWPAAAGALGLALLNYALRFLKWELYLWRLGVKVPVGESLVIFLAGFSLTMTPGKVGEVLKAYLLRETREVPMARTAPTVVAERATDLIALLALALGGVSALAGGRVFLWAAGILVAIFVVLASWRGLVHAILDAAARTKAGARVVPKLREFYDATWELMRPLPLAGAVALSLGAWAAECVAFWLVMRGFGAHPPLALSAFIYAAMTIAGALSFLPGGIGVQEAGMIELCVRTAGLARSTATAATVVVRVCTLWFAIAIGVICLFIVRRRVGARLDVLPAREVAQ